MSTPKLLQLDDISLNDLLSTMILESVITQNDIESLLGKNLLELREGIDSAEYDIIKTALAEGFGQNHGIDSKAKSFTDQRSVALKKFKELYQKYGFPFGVSEITFHNDVLNTYWTEVHGIKDRNNLGRYLNDLKLIENLDFITPEGKPINRGYVHATNLLKAIEHYLEKNGEINLTDDDVYKYLANKVPYAKDISEFEKDYLVGDYLVFRMAYSEEDYVNISNLSIRKSSGGSLFSLNKRMNGQQTLVYQSKGMVLRTVDRGVYVISVAESTEARNKGAKFYETMNLRVKWENHSRSAPYINGLYQGFVTEDMHPFCTRVFLIKMPVSTNKKYKNIKMSVPYKHFKSNKLEEIYNEPTSYPRLYPPQSDARNWMKLLHELNIQVLNRIANSDAKGTLDIDSVRLRITNKIDSKYHGLRHYHHLANEKEFAEEKKT